MDRSKHGFLPLAALEKILKGGSERRVSEDAKRVLGRELDGAASALAQEAVALAKHAGRRTIMREDIRLASGRRTGQEAQRYGPKARFS